MNRYFSIISKYNKLTQAVCFLHQALYQSTKKSATTTQHKPATNANRKHHAKCVYKAPKRALGARYYTNYAYRRHVLLKKHKYFFVNLNLFSKFAERIIY